MGVPLYAYFAKLAGNYEKLVMPVPCFNVVNGGSHAGNKLAFQVHTTTTTTPPEGIPTLTRVSTPPPSPFRRSTSSFRLARPPSPRR